jgi:hypothetical protein
MKNDDDEEIQLKLNQEKASITAMRLLSFMLFSLHHLLLLLVSQSISSSSSSRHASQPASKQGPTPAKKRTERCRCDLSSLQTMWYATLDPSSARDMRMSC